MFAAQHVLSTAIPAEKVFDGLISDRARSTLLRAGFSTFVPNSDAEVDSYVRGFSAMWRNARDPETPEPAEVRRLMSEQEGVLYDLWDTALRDDRLALDVPLVVQAPVMVSANPFVMRSRGLGKPLIVMSEGLWSLVSAGVLGLLHWAENQGEVEALGRKVLEEACRSWVTNEPQSGPSGADVARLATRDLDTTNFAVGLAHATYTWAFLHEVGHLALGHVATGERRLGISADGQLEATSRHYGHQDEIAADAFGFERFLGLMPLEREIRRRIPFGPQIDHAPMIGLDLIDLAYTLSGRTDLLESPTHPTPARRAQLLLSAQADRLSVEGCEWFDYWVERSTAMRKELRLSGL